MRVLRGCFWTLCLLGLVLPFGMQGQLPEAPVKTNKIIVYPKKGESISQLKQSGIQKIDNYGSYWVVRATDAQSKEIDRNFGDRAVKANHLSRIELSAASVDTAAGEPAIPSHLQQSDTAGKRLRLIQFRGPVKPEWLEQVKAAGDVKIVSYIPNNAYVLYLDEASENNLQKLTEPNGPIQWIGKYHPYYKIPTGLQQPQSGTVNVRVAVLDGDDAEQTVYKIASLALTGIESRESGLNQIVVTIQARSPDLSQIAQLPDVLWIEPVIQNIKHDEMQALILSSHTNDVFYYLHGPRPGMDFYLNFLNALGFSIDPAHYPVIDIADTGLDKLNPYPNSTGCGWSGVRYYVPFHPSFYAVGDYFTIPPSSYTTPPSDSAIGEIMCCAITESRVAYNTAGTDTDGHGTAVASVAAGFDNYPGYYETNKCFRDRRESLTITNLVLSICSSNYYPDLNDPTTYLTNFYFCYLPQVTNYSACVVYTNSGPTGLFPRPDPFDTFGATVYHQDGYGFQLGLGVSPFGRIGASLGGNQAGFAGAAGEISAAYLLDARISNNSWGNGLVIGQNDGVYNSQAQSYDALVRDAVTTGATNAFGETPLNQEMTIVFSAGDNNGVGGAGGYGETLVTPPATAKNVITVGASKNLHLGFRYSDIDNSFDIVDFSSFGPTADGRFKPEIVAPGTGISGALSQGTYTQPECFGCNPNSPVLLNCAENEVLFQTITSLYGGPGCGAACGIQIHYGTSFSAPAVSGGAQLLWWWFQNHLNMLQPSPAMVKAYLLNSARYLPITNQLTGAMDTLPSVAQGMGIMDLARMFDDVPRVLRDETTPRALDTPLLTTNPVPQQTYFSQSGQSYELSGVVADATQPFRVTLSWTDAPGTPMAFKELVNDLDLEVTIGGQTYKGNQFIGANSVTGCPHPYRPCPDEVNNTESVFLTNGAVAAGTPFTVLVRASNIAGNGVPNVKGSTLGQDCALVVYNAANNAFGSPSAPSDSPNWATNNTCQTAITITNFPFSFANTLSKAFYANVHPSPSAARGGVDEFFRIAKPTPGVVFTIDTTGSGFNNVLSVWRVEVASQATGHGCGALVEVASDNGGTLPSTVAFTADGSNDYFIVVEPYNDGPGGAMVLNVGATAPPITVTPSLIQFADQMVGTTSSMQTVTYRNNTTANIGISSVSITGSNAADFVIESQTCEGHTLLPSGNCTIAIAFAPTASGLKTAQLVINDNATGSPRTTLLSGNGIPKVDMPSVCVGGSLVFGNQFVGRPSPAQSITITNCGTAALVIGNAVITGVNAGDFAIASSSCSNVSPGGACAIGVTFTPTATGGRNAMLTLNDNAPGSPHNVLLSGTGVGCPPFAILPSALPSPATGIPYNQSLTVSGATLPVTFVLAAGTMPRGLSLTNGVISGTPTAFGSFSFKVAVTDANGCTGEKWYTGTVACPTITISPVTLPAGQMFVAYSQTLTAAGGASPYAFAQTGGSLPAGLTLSTNGVLSGTPTSGSSVFTVTATDANRCQGSRSYTINMADPLSPTTNTPPASPPTITVTPGTLPNATAGNAYSQTLSASGGAGPYSFTATGLPGGLALSNAGTLSGTPSGAGQFNFTVMAADTNGYLGSRAYSLVVSNLAAGGAAPDLQVSIAARPTLVSVLDSVTYTVMVTNAGPSAASGVTLTDTLPAGAKLVSAGTSPGYSQSVGAVSYNLGALLPGGSAQATIVVAPLKVGVLVNSATVAANESDPNMANNGANSTVMVSTAADVDLTGIGSVQQVCSRSANPICRLTAKLTCTNQGTATSPAAKVRFYLSGSSSLGSDAVVLGKDLSTGRLKAGKSRQMTFRAKLPVGTNASGQYVIAVIDPDNLVAESDKTNNTIVMEPIP